MSDEKSKFCSLCGTSVNVDDTFCNNCGASLGETVKLDTTIPVHQPVSQSYATPHVATEKPYVKKTYEFAKISLIVGAAAFILSNIRFVRFLCIPLCLVSVALGVIVIAKKEKKLGFAIGGIILCVLALASYVTSWFFDWWHYIL